MSRPKSNLVGQRFGRLVVLQLTGKDAWGKYVWLCICDCGKEKVIRGGSLKSNATKSCGCLHIERLTKHGHKTKIKVSKIYRVWDSMFSRCTNSKHKYYQHYGGRGITLCKRWMKFENFLTDMGEPPTQEHSIDRIDNSGNYCKSNCRWATKKEQARNKRNNHLETYNSKTQCLVAWAEEFDINYNTLMARLGYGWSIEKALTTSVQKRKKASL